MLKIEAFEKMSALDIERELDTMYKEPGGVDKIAALGLQPIQEDVLYESRARQILAEYILAPGEEAVFDGDVRVPGWSLSVSGLPYQVQVLSNRVRIDTSPISSKALVRWNESNYRKFDMLDWTQARAKSTIMELEDTRVISVLDAASEGFHPTVVSTGRLLVEAIAEAKARVSDALRTSAVRLVIPVIRERDLIVLNTTAAAPIYAPTVQDELIRKGMLGEIAGLEILSIPRRQDGTTIINPNFAYVVGPKELVGLFVVRSEIVPKTQVSVKDEGDIICYWEDVNPYLRYSKGVCKIRIA